MRPTRITSLLNSLLTPLASARLTPLLMALSLSCTTGDKAAEDTSNIAPSAEDLDRDGYFSDEDCNDADSAINPGAAEICDGVDNNCDLQVDEGATATWYADTDGDGFGDVESSTEACEAPEGYSNNASDCDDQNADAYPGAIDVCDGVDNNCDGSTDEDEALTWYADADGDTWGDAAITTTACEEPVGYTAVSGDCDDSTAEAWPGHAEVCDEIDNDCDGDIDEDVKSVFYEDRDSDGWGDLAEIAEACVAPTGYSPDGGDCDDDDAAFHPYAPEADCTDPNDYNCDGSVGYADDDADGWAACEDCDDSLALVNPDGLEICNDIDDDCDGLFDDDDSDIDLSTGSTWYEDSDSDAYGDLGSPTLSCDQPTGFVTDSTDCDDDDGHVHPAASEVCNGVDDDCDTLIDDADSTVDLSTGTTWYGDGDTDGYGAASKPLDACLMPTGYVANDDDCNDGAVAINPAALEICDSIDNDCDALIDDADPSLSSSTGSTWYADADTDGYGSASSTTMACLQPTGYTTDKRDCDDTNIAINPAATEICDDLDNDCDSKIDDADPNLDTTTGSTWYRDADSDAFGSASTTKLACDQPTGYLTDATDCNDGVSAINPAAAEICDSLDNDCDSKIDDADTSLDTSTATKWYEDKDTDGYGITSVYTYACTVPSGYTSVITDCDDTDSTISPADAEYCDGVDNDCDGAIDEADAVDYPCTTVIEDFESGWPRTGWTTVGGWGSLSTTRYEGSYAALNPDWSYYTGAKIAIGDTVGMWIRGGSGRAYLGFDSSSSGTKSFVVAYNTGDIRFQNNASWSYSELNTTSMSIPTGQWLYMAVTLNSTTSATGRLYNSSGTLLGSVSQTYSSISGTGYVAIRSFSTIYIDYIDSY